MSAQQQADTQKDVYGIICDKVAEHLEKGIVPWQVPWDKAGVPTNLASGNQYKGINIALLSALGYERNLFITENQLQELDGAIKAKEKPHIIASWNAKDGDKAGTLGYHRVYNIAQCVGINPELIQSPTSELDGLGALERIVAAMPACPAIKHKDDGPYYDARLDVVNMPKKASYSVPEQYYVHLLKQLIHSTGHHLRLDRMGLAQMAECGYPRCSIEILVAEIALHYFVALTGTARTAEIVSKSATEWLTEVRKSKYLIFTGFTLAIKAIGFITGKETDDKNQ